MTAALARFGSVSLFDTIRSSDKASYNVTVSGLCGQSAWPFFGVMASSSDIVWYYTVWQSDRSRGELPVDDDSWTPAMEDLLGDRFVKLLDEKHSEGFLEMGMFLAKDTVLVNSEAQKEGRVRYCNLERSITKSKFSVCPIVTVSALLGLHTTVLFFLMCLHPRYEYFGVDRWPVQRMG